MKRNSLGSSIASALMLLAGTAQAWAQSDAPVTMPSPAAAEAPRPEYKGPTAKEIIERYLEVTGGRAAYEKITNRETVGTMEIPQQGLKGTTTMLQAAPNKMRMRIDLGGFGSQTTGTDGHDAWSIDTMQGARILEGEEKAAMLRQATFNGELNWESVYKEAKAEAEEEVNGKPAYAVTMTTPDGQKSTNYYEKESGLLVKTMTVAKSPMGEIPMESAYTDFKQVDGITMPHKTTISSAMGMQIIMTIESLRQNIDLAPDAFAMPEEVRKLAESSQPAGEKKE
ncbi:MAG: hypothetical protein JNK58_09095 [Phycisphaerae bacterium]|nr:hypothetical protein [Phycisphaerae bacterium]